jgi:hypothetical protein
VADVARLDADPGLGPERAHRSRHVVGPLVLLGLGVLLLLNNLGYLPWTIWSSIWPYWPLLLVLLGVEAFATGRVAWGTLVLLLVLVPLIGFAITFGSVASHWSEATSSAPDRLTSTIHQLLNGATSAAVRIEYGVGALDVGPLAEDASSDLLVDGQIFGHGSVQFDTRYDVSNGLGTLRIGPRDGSGLNGSGSVDLDAGRVALRFNRTIPLNLRIDTGAAVSTLNLADLHVTNLTIQTGASRSQIMLPAHGETTVRIEGGAATIALAIPDTVAARIMVDDGPNAIQIDQTRFPKDGREYRSPGFDTATDRATIRLSVGASRVVVQ